jgi:hypothetical protein
MIRQIQLLQRLRMRFGAVSAFSVEPSTLFQAMRLDFDRVSSQGVSSFPEWTESGTTEAECVGEEPWRP